MMARYSVDNTGNEYVVNQLMKGSSYARTVLEMVPIHNGHVLTYLPPRLSAWKHEFTDSILGRAGGVGESGEDPSSDIEQEALRVLALALVSKADGCAVFEALESPSSSNLNRQRNPYFVYMDEVYLFVTNLTGTFDGIRSCARSTRKYPEIIGLTSCAHPALTITPGARVDITSINLLAKNTELLLVGAYDDESYLIWSKENPPVRLG